MIPITSLSLPHTASLLNKWWSSFRVNRMIKQACFRAWLPCDWQVTPKVCPWVFSWTKSSPAPTSTLHQNMVTSGSKKQPGLHLPKGGVRVCLHLSLTSGRFEAGWGRMPSPLLTCHPPFPSSGESERAGTEELFSWNCSSSLPDSLILSCWRFAQVEIRGLEHGCDTKEPKESVPWSLLS